MKRLKRHVIRLRVRLAGLGAGARFAAAVLATVIAGGSVWLIWAMVSPEPMTVVARGLDRETRQIAEAAFERAGIRFVRTEGGLAVSTPSVSAARKVLDSDIADVKAPSRGLRSLSDGSSMWRSSAENRRLWQADVMAQLGRLVTEMDPVASASVLFEPGSTGGLGAQRRTARAAVKVTLARGRRMTPGLVVAIAELVSGSVAVEAGDVRVIDQTGRSYRASPHVESLARRHAVEAYYGEKIASALRYIPGMTVDTQIIGARAGLSRPPDWHQLASDGLRVRVSTPRSYFSSTDGEESTAQQLASIKDAVRAILGPAGGHEVTVSMHGSSADVGPGVSQARGGLSWITVLAAVMSFATGAMGLWLLCRWGTSVRRPNAVVSSPQGEEVRDELRYDTPGAFRGVGDDQHSEDLAREHPQTLALILARMPSDQADETISRLPVDLRNEVVRRMGDLDDVDAAVVSEINRDLTSAVGGRAVNSPPDAEAGAPENIDRRRAERDALNLMAFEDVILVGAAELRVALGAVEADDLAISLRMASRQVRRKVLGCLVSRDAEYVRARMDRIGPMRICDVESARQRVMETVSQAVATPATGAPAVCDQTLEGVV